MKQALKLTFVALLILTSLPAASAAFNGTLAVGTPVELNATDLTAICRDISRDGNSAWIELEKDGEVRYSHILKPGDPIVYESDSGLLTYQIDATFHGTQTNMAKISQIDPAGIDMGALRTRPDSILLGIGERRNLSDGTEIVHKMMGVNGDKALIELVGDGMGQYSHILKEGDPIVYKNDSDEWAAYRIDAIFHGIEHDMIELSPVDQPIDPSTIDFNYVEGLWDNFILDVGAEKDIGSGTTLRCTGIDMTDGVAWVELSKNGTVQYSHILKEGECATYEYSGMLHACEVHRVFTGVGGNLVEFSPVKVSEIDAASIPDRSEYVMVGLGVPVELSGGAELLCKQIDLGGEAVWIEIERSGHEKFEKVINRTHPSFAYRVDDTEYVYDLEAVFRGKEKSAIEISFAGSSPVVDGGADILNHTPAPTVPAFTASGAIVVLGLLAVVRGRRRRHS
ncbi:MAG: hypothetical protein J7J06_10290 [Methanosarcinales archaeon]|nr:hypothetical protein [Methanosarcinales archaeon]